MTPLPNRWHFVSVLRVGFRPDGLTIHALGRVDVSLDVGLDGAWGLDGVQQLLRSRRECGKVSNAGNYL
jgi:hypothetical protein